MQLFKLLFLSVCLFAICLIATPNATAQGKRQIVQVSGLVVTGENQVGVQGAYFFVPKAARGCQTNSYGYFSMATQAGDSAIISEIGYKRQYYKIPDDGRNSISVIIYLKEDTTFEPLIEVLPYQTEASFKEAFLELKLDDQDRANMRRNLDEETLKAMRFNMKADGSLNHQYFMQNAIVKQENRYMGNAVQLTNPFAWARFIKSIHRGELKNRDPYNKNRKD